MDIKLVYLMRGLPGCGKSHMAQRLAGETGLICETDQYFHGFDSENRPIYSYSESRLQEAREWNFRRFKTP